jgi:hypothetical protein
VSTSASSSSCRQELDQRLADTADPLNEDNAALEIGVSERGRETRAEPVKHADGGIGPGAARAASRWATTEDVGAVLGDQVDVLLADVQMPDRCESCRRDCSPARRTESEAVRALAPREAASPRSRPCRRRAAGRRQRPSRLSAPRRRDDRPRTRPRLPQLKPPSVGKRWDRNGLCHSVCT